MPASPRLVALLFATACGRGPAIVGPPDDDEGEDTTTTDTGEPPGCDLDSHTRDCDGDGIPDGDDPFPTEPSRPGRARADVIYVHDATVLSTMDPADAVLREVGMFRFPEGPDGQVTDIAIDRFGVLYAIASSVLHACDPAIAHCWALASVPTNSLAFVPLGTIEPDDDTLVTLAGSTWTRVDLRGPEVTPNPIADVPSPYASSGDIATTASGLTVFTSPSGGVDGDVVVAIDPTSGAVLGEVGPVLGSTGVWGVAAVRGELWLFDQLGTIWTMDPSTGSTQVVGVEASRFWGAAAHPELR
ncbi:MAG: hypothetical protein JNK45_21845 [Myxococcales bacterium]|nr:hypothetical protein [Myxococcales bacterium]